MSPALIGVLVTLAITGLILAITGMIKVSSEERIRPPGRTQTFITNTIADITKQQKVVGIVGLATGFVIWLISGWVIYLLVAPAAALGLPLLLGSGKDKETLKRLEALESWTRGLSGLTTAGIGLEETILSSLKSAPLQIQPELQRLCARINARWKTADSLRAFAADLNDTTADIIVAHLILAERQRGDGLSDALTDLAESIFDEIKVRRSIETDRAKARSNIRMITGITAGLLALIPLLSQYMQPYSTPTGQLILLALISANALLLLWMTKIMRIPSSPRILTGRE